MWVKEISGTWWNEIVSKFSDDEWQKNFHMSKSTFMYICREITPENKKEDTKLRKAISVEKRVPITIWHLSYWY